MQRHHSTSLQAVDIINDLRAQPYVLQEWGFPPMHCRIAARQLGVFTDFGGLQHFALEHADLGQPFPQPAKLDEPPLFLNQMIFYSSAANFRPSLWLGASVAHVLSHGIPTAAPFPSRPHGQGHQMKWAVRTEDT